MEPSPLYLQGNEQASPLIVVANNSAPSTSKPFIEANTVDVELHTLQQHHIIPVYRDNSL